LSRVGGEVSEVLGAPASSILCLLAGRDSAVSAPLTSLMSPVRSAVVVPLVCGRCVLRFAESRSRQRPPLKTGFDRRTSSPIEKLTSIPSSAISMVHGAPEQDGGHSSGENIFLLASAFFTETSNHNSASSERAEDLSKKHSRLDLRCSIHHDDYQTNEAVKPPTAAACIRCLLQTCCAEAG